MGQTVRKKKGRPAKADPGARGSSQSERELRRSNRRRNVKYVFELDDYFDDEGLFEDDEDQQRREKKLKLLLKVDSKDTYGGTQPESAGPTPGSTGRHVRHPTSPSSSSSSDFDQPSKKRKIDEGIDDENGDASDDDDCNDDHVEARERKSEFKATNIDLGTHTGAAPSGLLPDKKTLEFVLTIIQRKDTYHVFSEPVDPEELPDYHGVIKNPMDFGTVRNKLRNGLYATLEQFENDVFLICANAMQYNAPDTIYYKQARAMHELAKRKFDELNLHSSRISEKKSKYEQNIRSSSILNKQVKSPVSRTVQDPVGSDFSCGTTLGTVVDIQHVSNALLAVGSSKPCSVDRLVEKNSFLNDNNLDKGEALMPGNSSLPKSGRKLSGHDENRRATYNISLTHPLSSSESLFSTFEGESKQLVPVGAYAENSYARSLARFAAALGSVAWKISSKRIEQALPQEVKYGRGWVEEYEPLSTPVLMLENCMVKEPPFFSKKLPDVSRKLEKIPTVSVTSKEFRSTMPFLEKNLQSVVPAKIRPACTPITLPMKSQPNREHTSELKASFFPAPSSKPITSVNLNRQHKKTESKSAVESEKQGLKQVELNELPTFNKNAVDFTGHGRMAKSSEVEVSSSIFTSRNINFTASGPVKQPDIKEVFRRLPNGKVVCDKIDSNSVASSSSNLAKGVGYYPQEQGQGLSDPVHLMRMIAEKAQNQQKSLYQSLTDSPRVSSPAPNRDDLNTITAVSNALRSVGVSGFRPISENTNPFKNQLHGNFLNISTRDTHSQGSQFREESPASVIHYQPDRNSSPHNVFVSQGGPQRMRVGNDMHFRNQSMAFPPFPRPDSRQISESLPPDLNVGFQSPGSPGKNPSSGGLVESQQPDLALQL